jgi:hypothetical protein
VSWSAFRRVAGGSEVESTGPKAKLSGPKAEGGWEGCGFSNRSTVAPSMCAVSLFQMRCDARAKADEF